MIRRKRFLLVLGLLAVLLVQGTYAYYTAKTDVDNQFTSAEAKIYLNEKFDPKDKWVPGEEKQKEVRFGNQGRIDAVLRARFKPVLKLKDGSIDEEAGKQFLLNFSEEFDSQWVKHGDWYYYKKVLGHNDLTDITLKTVTISKQIGNDEHGIKTDYTGASFDIEIKGELVQASLAEEGAEYMGWDMVPHVSGSNVSWTE